MHALKRGLAAFFLLCLTLVSQAPAVESKSGVAALEGASLVYLLWPSLADSYGIKLASEFDVVDGLQVILLTLDGNLFDLTRHQPLLAKKSLQVTSFTVSEGLLIAIRNNRLGWYEDGEIRERIELPSKGMRVVAGMQQRLYVYGSQGQGSAVYLLQDGKALSLLDIPKGRISAFAAIGKRIFFAIDNVIYTIADGEHAGLVFVASGQKSIRSLAPDPTTGLLYFSAGETVYAMRAGTAISIVRGLAGFLRYSKNALFVLDPERKRLIKVMGLEMLTISGRSETAPVPGKFKE